LSYDISYVILCILSITRNSLLDAGQKKKGKKKKERREEEEGRRKQNT